MKRLLLVLALLSPGAASAQGRFDGVWTGQAGEWKIRLQVAGKRGQLTLTCTTVHRFDIPVGEDGTIDSWLSSQTFERRQIAGRLPSLIVPTAGRCKGGPTNLKR
ncbi:MAG: hypothetical protein AB7O88_08575 [Reyranellaceae bacterium]